MGLLEGKRAIVTGGGSGIGRATCRRMAEEGAQVAVLDINGEAAKAVADEFGGVGFAVDVGEPDAVREVVDTAVAALGGLSILYNNAGIGDFNRLTDWDLAKWDGILKVNLTGVFAGFRAAIPHLLAGGGGAIVSTASIRAPDRPQGKRPMRPARPRSQH